MKFSHWFLSLLLMSLLFYSCNNSQRQHEELIIFHAGSLSVPVKQITEAFKQEHPGVEIFAEAAGSVASARKISDLSRPCHVFLSADYNVINKFLIPKHADWNIKFASNEMVLAFNPESHKADQINSSNWPEILSDGEVRYGRSDPNSDPCGYRTVISLKLTEKTHGIPGLANSLLSKDQRYMRPKETDLIALLETHTIDYFFIYRSVASQHHLNYIILGDSINLRNPNLASWYKSEWVEINGKKPGEKIKQYGEAMIYGLTIPKNTPNQQLAEEFAAFILDRDKGQRILEENEQPSLVPSPTAQWDKIPEALQKFALPVD